MDGSSNLTHVSPMKPNQPLPRKNTHPISGKTPAVARPYTSSSVSKHPSHQREELAAYLAAVEDLRDSIEKSALSGTEEAALRRSTASLNSLLTHDHELPLVEFEDNSDASSSDEEDTDRAMSHVNEVIHHDDEAGVVLERDEKGQTGYIFSTALYSASKLKISSEHTLGLETTSESMLSHNGKKRARASITSYSPLPTTNPSNQKNTHAAELDIAQTSTAMPWTCVICNDRQLVTDRKCKIQRGYVLAMACAFKSWNQGLDVLLSQADMRSCRACYRLVPSTIINRLSADWYEPRTEVTGAIDWTTVRGEWGTGLEYRRCMADWVKSIDVTSTSSITDIDGILSGLGEHAHKSAYQLEQDLLSLQSTADATRQSLESTVLGTRGELKSALIALAEARQIAARKDAEVTLQHRTIVDLQGQLQQLSDNSRPKDTKKKTTERVDSSPPKEVRSSNRISPDKHTTISRTGLLETSSTDERITSLMRAFDDVVKVHGTFEALGSLQSQFPGEFADVAAAVIMSEIDDLLVPSLVERSESSAPHENTNGTQLASIWKEHATLTLGKAMTALYSSPGDQNGTLCAVGDTKLVHQSALQLLVIGYNRDKKVGKLFQEPATRLLRYGNIPPELRRANCIAGLSASASTEFRSRELAKKNSQGGRQACLEYAIKKGCPLTMVFDNVDWQLSAGGIHILGAVVLYGKPPKPHSDAWGPRRLIDQQSVSDFTTLTNAETAMRKRRMVTTIASSLLLSTDEAFETTVSWLIDNPIAQDGNRRPRTRGRPPADYRPKDEDETSQSYMRARTIEQRELPSLREEASGSLKRIIRPGDLKGPDVQNGRVLCSLMPGDVVRVHDVIPERQIAIVTTVSKRDESEPSVDDVTSQEITDAGSISGRTRSKDTHQIRNVASKVASEFSGIIHLAMLTEQGGGPLENSKDEPDLPVFRHDVFMDMCEKLACETGLGSTPPEVRPFCTRIVVTPPSYLVRRQWFSLGRGSSACLRLLSSSTSREILPQVL